MDVRVELAKLIVERDLSEVIPVHIFIEINYTLRRTNE